MPETNSKDAALGAAHQLAMGLQELVVEPPEHAAAGAGLLVLQHRLDAGPIQQLLADRPNEEAPSSPNSLCRSSSTLGDGLGNNDPHGGQLG